MSKIASFVSLALVTLDRARAQPLHRQIYSSLQGEILEGRLKAGTRLPSTRALAKDLGVSRNTVSRAYEQLLDEGYLESRVGSGTRVTQTLPEHLPVKALVTSSEPPAFKSAPRLSERGQAVLRSSGAPWSPAPYFWQPQAARAFNPASPALDAFPSKVWEKCLAKSWRSLEPGQLAYGSPLGYTPLREALATYMQLSRSVRCTPQQVVITGGTQQALMLIAYLLLNKGDAVWVENPSFNGIHVALQGALARIVPVGVDQQGLKVKAGIRKAPEARLVYISPSHQYPLGVTMSLTRRLELLSWAESQGAWIIEDDYDSEFRYAGYPLAALQGLDKAGHVIYLGTFSKVLFPALRLGYMVVPPALVAPLEAARACTDRGLNLLMQATLYTFMQEGHFARHIRRMRTLYARRQAHLLEALRPYQHLIKAEPHDAGLHLVAWLSRTHDDRAVSLELSKRGVDAPALSSFALSPLKRQGLLLGYTAPEPELDRAVHILVEVLRD